SNWAVAGDVGSLNVLGSLSADIIYAGNDAGPDHIPGTADDTYRPAVIGSIKVKGGITSSTIGAGIQPPSGGLTLLPGTPIPGGKIRSITVRGAVSSDTRFLAASLPKTAILGGTRVNTNSDPRFKA
ncbi:MAG TPA: hypothetical protein VN541_06970, partial [Tepidisphaeraceae bacterium]|nr:hypothetical protein [Tepidisphaeraceae bacterium]